VLKRVFTAAGANRQFVNGSPTTLNLLAEVGDWLVDMHGPHDHQSLLQPARQLALLDAFGRLEPKVAAFGELVRQRAAVMAEKAALVVDERTYAQQLDLLRFQVREISAAQLQPDEEATVEQDFQRASNAARLLQLGQAALNLLGEDDNSVTAQAGALGRVLQDLRHLDPGAEPLLGLHEQAAVALRELQADLSHYLDRVEVDPARLQQLEERLNLVHALKRKYGASLTEVIRFGEEAAARLRQLEGRDAELARLNTKLARLEAELGRAGAELSTQRREAAPRLARAVAKQLADLGFQQSRLNLALTSLTPPDANNAQGPPIPVPATATGLDTVEFQFAPNPGEPPRPLRAIASSGEMARVMLAIKTVLAAEDEIPVLVFDEVDANVGGETANAVGEKMRQIAQRRQVLCITHLPQVAAAASAHFEVSKAVRDGRTVSEMRLLDPKDRVTELARMLGGQSDVARKHAAALLAHAG
jgi:DNA repair protein RecN (Recombination protein N)